MQIPREVWLCIAVVFIICKPFGRGTMWYMSHLVEVAEDDVLDKYLSVPTVVLIDARNKAMCNLIHHLLIQAASGGRGFGTPWLSPNSNADASGAHTREYQEGAGACRWQVAASSGVLRGVDTRLCCGSS